MVRTRPPFRCVRPIPYPKGVGVENALANRAGIKIDCDVADDIAAGKRPPKLIRGLFSNVYKGFRGICEIAANFSCDTDAHIARIWGISVKNFGS